MRTTSQLACVLIFSASPILAEPLSGQQLTGWEMMHGRASQQEILSFSEDGALRLQIVGQPTQTGHWSVSRRGEYCVSLDQIDACFSPEIHGTRAAIVLHDDQGGLLRMWSGELSPIP